MDLQNRPAVRATAARNLAAAPGEPKKTVRLYAVGTALASLVVTLLLYLLDDKIADTGGLGNLGIRSVLETVRYILPLALNISMLCVAFGYATATLRMARKQSCGPQTLLEGFRSFGPLVRLLLLQLVIYCAIAFLMMYLALQIFLMTPLSNDFLEVLMPLVSSSTVLDSGIVLDDATLAAATSAMLPMIPIFLGLFLLVAAPVYYQYRMAQFALVDDPRRGAIAALRTSRTMMRRNRLNLFKLDLGFWWFYLAQFAISVIGYGDLLLPLVGVELPLSDTAGSLVFYILSLVLQVVLFVCCLNRVQVTYATVYDQLRPQPQEPTKVALGNIFEM